MKLSFEKIKEITTGAVDFLTEDGCLCLKRFTKKQEELYKVTNTEFYEKTFSTSGIKLLFKTDSKSLFMKIKTSKSSSRKYFSLDVLVDGKLIDSLDNFSDMELPQDYTKLEYPLGEFSKNFQLGEGEKTVCVHLPWSVKTLIEEVSLDDNAFVNAIKKKNKLLVYGDSITHGYDALRPSNRYITKIADLLDAEEYNKAIGGEMFFPKLSELKDSFEPDYITVSYGSNDWKNIDEETFKLNCKAFFENISNNYPNSKIFAITPIWRKDMNEQRKFGDFRKVEQDIRSVTENIKNITVISGFDFVPKDEKYFADLRLHPNDSGFGFYFDNLSKEIKANLI